VWQAGIPQAGASGLCFECYFGWRIAQPFDSDASRQPVKADQTGGHCCSSFLHNRSIQHLLGFVIEIAKAISLDSIGDDRKQQMPR
jgi:hypothetical protein